MSLVKHSPFNFDNSNVSSNPPFLGIHWRLGDLLSINSKQPIVEGKLFGTIKALDLADCKDLELKLASDSESIALKKFKAQFPNSKISVVRGGSFSLIENLIPSNIFVGTNSKLSFWIALARHVFYPERYSYLPIEIAHHFAPNSIRGSNIRFY
jgi:hypothetical protein